MMIKKLVTLSTLASAVAFGSAQFKPTPVSRAPSHYLLTFVVTDSSAKEQKQTYSLEVNVAPETPGEARMTMASGSAAPNRISFGCTEVRQTEDGLAMKVSMEMVHTLEDLAPGTNEHIIRQVNYSKKLTLPIGATQNLLPSTGTGDKDKVTVTITAETI